MTPTLAPPVRELVLIGGGHSHVQVLKRLAMAPPPGIRTTVIARESHTPYSGMLPGHIAGHYTFDQIHIDLGPLAQAAGARFIADEVSGLDPDGQTIQLLDHPDFRYDVVSINCGATPGFSGVEIDTGVVPVKPIGRFLPHWNAIRTRSESRLRSGESVHIAIVGGGAGGVELALAVHFVLGGIGDLRVTLATASERLLAGHNQRVQTHFEQLFASRGIRVERNFDVRRVAGGRLESTTDESIDADEVFWVTGVEAPEWPRRSGLAVNEQGFILVDDFLRSTSHDTVFSTGDVAGVTDQLRPKSGVFAVRQGPALADNLIRTLEGRRLRRFRAQTRFLSLISEGGRVATASRGDWFATGAWVWRWKDWIDRRFMRRFQELPDMVTAAPTVAPALQDDLPDSMRCGGCGSKLGADMLTRVLRKLPTTAHPDVDVGIGDDAALLKGNGSQIVISVDSFRSMIDDPYLFGRIATHHSLNDIFAMGAQPVAALAIVTVQLMAEQLMEDDLYLLMRGAVDVLNEQGVALAGGHSSEGAETSLGFAVTGSLVDKPMTKGGLRDGDVLLLTKPLGTGVLLAANMVGKARSQCIAAAVNCMDQSNAKAAQIIRAHGAAGCTDVTGFGLLGHLGEMLRAAKLSARLDVSAIPHLQGALELFDAGEASSLQANNEQIFADCRFEGCSPTESRVRVLADPQTAGGLLAGVDAAGADACLRALLDAGFSAAAIGKIDVRDDQHQAYLQLLG